MHSSRVPTVRPPSTGSVALAWRRPNEPEFKWVNTGLGNIKSAIAGTCRAVRPRHAARYLAAYEYRFNRRFELHKMVERLATVAVKTTPQPRYVISPEVMSG